MRSRKVRYGEQKLLDLIDEEMEKVSNLDYSNIKDKIIINEEKGIKEVENKTNFIVIHLKYVLSIVLLIIGIVTYCTVCTLTNENIFEKNYYLTDVIVEEFENGNTFRTSINYYQNTNLLSVIVNDNKQVNYIELTISEETNRKYYCAYLDKDIIKKINDYFNENDIYNSKIFRELYQNSLFIGVDMMLLKTYIYYEKNNIDKLFSSIKWIEHDFNDNIQYEINNYQLIYLAINNKVKSAIDVKTNNEYTENIVIYNEIDFDNNTILFDINEYQNRKFIYPISKSEYNIQQNISIKFLENYCAEIVYLNNISSIYINIPIWYETYIKYNDENIYFYMKDEIELVSNMLDILDDYKINEEVYKFSDDLYYNRYYYDYNKVKLFFIS